MAKPLVEDFREFLKTERGEDLVAKASPAIGVAAADVAAAISTIPIALISRKMAKGSFNPKEPLIAKLLEKLEGFRKKGLTPGIYIAPDQVAGYGLSTKQVTGPPGITPHLLAHELGHVSPKGRIFGPKILTQSYRLKSLAPVVAALVGTAAAGKALSGEDTEGAVRLAKGTAIAAGALSVPMLYEEARATTHGVRYLKDIGMSWKKIIGKAGPLLAGQLTYPALALLPALGLYLGAKKLEESQSKKRVK